MVSRIGLATAWLNEDFKGMLAGFSMGIILSNPPVLASKTRVSIGFPSTSA